MNKAYLYVATIVLAICSLPCIAEVSDKIPSNTENFIRAFVLAVTLGAVALFRWWLGVLGVAVFVLYAESIFLLWQETSMREALLYEQGWFYFGTLAVGSLLIFCFTIFGAIMSLRRRKNAQRN